MFRRAFLVSSEIRPKKPKMGRFKLTKPAGNVIASDGKNVWILAERHRNYGKCDAEAKAENFADSASPAGMFLGHHSRNGRLALSGCAIAGEPVC